MIKRNDLRLAALSAAIAISLFARLSGMAPVGSHEAASGAVCNPAADGAALYDGKCAICHGKNGVGLPNWKSQGQPDFTIADWQKAHTDEQIADSIKNG